MDIDYRTALKYVLDDIARSERMAKRKTKKYKVGDIVRIKRGRTIGDGKKAGCNTKGVITNVKECSKFNYTEYHVDLFLSEEEEDNRSLYYRRFNQDDIAECRGRFFDDDDISVEEISFLF